MKGIVEQVTRPGHGRDLWKLEVRIDTDDLVL